MGTSTRRPLVSVRVSTPPSVSAELTWLSMSSGVEEDSTTSSRWACWMPILISMGGPLGGSVVVGEGVAPDAPPGEAGDQGDRVVAADAGGVGHPEPRADLRHSHQRDREEQCCLVGEPGVVVDD